MSQIDPQFACFLTVRAASSRLPGKALLRLGQKTVLEHLIDRIRDVRAPAPVIVCTTINPEDDEIERIAASCKVPVYRGSSGDKLVRWLGAAHQYAIDYFVAVDGDDLFCDPELIDSAIRQMRERPCDVIRAPEELVCGAFTWCISTKVLARACARKTSNDTEMIWQYFADLGDCRVAELTVGSDRYFLPKVRLTLDYPEDYLFFAKVFEELPIVCNTVPLRKILDLLERRPDLPAINWFRQEEFLHNQRRRALQVAPIPAAGKGWRFRGNELEYVREVLESGFGSSTSGTMNTRFEAAFARKLGVAYAVTSNSGTSTLHQALEAFGIGPGDEVILPALTVVMCGFAVLHAGATPVFADVNPETFLIDPEDVRRKITPRTRAIMPVHLYGQVCDMAPLLQLAAEHDLMLLEDCAQCFLATDAQGRLAGTIGHAASFSFENSKHLSTGDGGMLVTGNAGLAQRMRKFGGLGFRNIQASTGQVRRSKDVFQDPAYLRHDSFGYNYRMPEVAAAVGLAQLENAELLVARRVAMGAAYCRAIGDCSWLIPQSIPAGAQPSYYTFAARFDGAEKRGISWHEFRRRFMDFGGDGVYAAWALVYREPAFAMLRESGSHFAGIPRRRCSGSDVASSPECPAAEWLQPRLMQFTTNQSGEPEMEVQAEALTKAIRYYD